MLCYDRDVIVLTETWLHDDILNGDVVPLYTSFKDAQVLQRHRRRGYNKDQRNRYSADFFIFFMRDFMRNIFIYAGTTL